MLTPSIVIAVAFLQQPFHETPAARAARLTAFDSSKAAVSHVGASVAEVKSALDVYRRAVFNGPDAEVLHNADYLRASCQTVDSVAKRMATKICRSCGAADVQVAFDDFRRMLPSLSRGAARCAAQIWQLERAGDAAKRLRHDVRVIGNPLIVNLRGYEARLGVLLKALHLVGTAPVPPGPARRPGPTRP